MRQYDAADIPCHRVGVINCKTTDGLSVLVAGDFELALQLE